MLSDLWFEDVQSKVPLPLLEFPLSFFHELQRIRSLIDLARRARLRKRLVMSKTAGIIIIGNEVLSGKTQDTNSHFLCVELRRLGVEVQKISTIQDEIDLIGQEVANFSKRFDFVFTTGGVGPTHDDVTIEGIAQGFSVPVIRHPEIENRMRQRLGGEVNDARLRMANVPEGAVLLATEALFAPVMNIHNVYIFPGIPRILQERFDAIKERFRGSPYFLKNVFLRYGEGVIASTLNDLLTKFPHLLLGSYPVLDLPDYKVKVTLESKDSDYLDSALKTLVASLPQDAVHRID